MKERLPDKTKITNSFFKNPVIKMYRMFWIVLPINYIVLFSTRDLRRTGYVLIYNVFIFSGLQSPAKI